MKGYYRVQLNCMEFEALQRAIDSQFDIALDVADDDFAYAYVGKIEAIRCAIQRAKAVGLLDL